MIEKRKKDLKYLSPFFLLFYHTEKSVKKDEEKKIKYLSLFRQTFFHTENMKEKNEDYEGRISVSEEG